jgi:lactate permease
LLGPELTDILSSLAAILSTLLLSLFWKPRNHFVFDGAAAESQLPPSHGARRVLSAWTPYAMLVICVFVWGQAFIKSHLERATQLIEWPGLHKLVIQTAPVTASDTPYAAAFRFNWLSASGTSCMVACLLSAIVLGIGPRTLWKVLRVTSSQMAKPALTVACVLALAFLMNYCGATATLGLAFAATGVVFPFFSAILGWLGVFLTGSDTSANALFGNLQKVTAAKLHLNPILMAAANSSGGVMGKMISLQSIAVAAAATGMPQADESRLFRFTLRHSILLASVIGLVVLFYAYVMPEWAPKP